MIRFSCPACLSIHDRSDREAGTKFACPLCGQRLEVPPPPRTAAAARPTRFAKPPPPAPPAAARSASRLPRILSLAGGGLLTVAACVAIVLANLPSSPPPLEGPRTEPNHASSSEPLSNASLASQAQEILRTHCYRCHGEQGAAEGGFNFVLDRDRLVARKKLVPGEAARSPLFRRIERGEMPPEGETSRPGPQEIALLQRWIESGAPAPETPLPRSEFMEEARVAALVHADVRTLPARERRFSRYFTLTSLANAGLSEDELQTYRFALAKLVNSLSWNKDIIKPRPVDPAQTIFRIDIRDYSWNDRSWQRLLAAYPHGVVLDTAEARACRVAAEGQLSYVRADWFVAAAARPPLYHELLQLPEQERALEKQLHIDVQEDIRQERVSRAGFNGSGVSRNNRLIERHASPYGSYWRSYDFIDNRGQRNLFAHPLGPELDDRSFRADGGEIIFSLPNGLQAFMLVNAAGQRLDKAPLTIVSDAKRPDRAVENGVSCMRCHARGLLAKADQVRGHLKNNPTAFPVAEAETIGALYPPSAEMAEMFARDNRRYRRAIEQLGGRLTDTEPIAALVLQYEKELDLTAASAEIGLRPAELAARLKQSPTLGRTLGPLRSAGGTIQRQVFNDAFSDLIRELQLGTPLSEGSSPPR